MLPTCPACKQSVLDDDAVNCPFCGANMKTGQKGAGKPPASKPASKPAASSGSSPAATASHSGPPAKTVTSQRAASSSAADDDDPFGVAAAVNSRAIPLSPRPTKGKTLRITCPMCETIGFGPSDAPGKEVKCCNEQCALPVFTAPKTALETTPQQARASATTAAAKSTGGKSLSPALMLTFVGTLALAGGSLWYFVFKEPEGVRPPPAPPPDPGRNSGLLVVTPPADENPGEARKLAADAKPRGADVRAKILSAMVDVSRVSEKNRSKQYCRRMTAEAYVEAGDLAAARENIDQLVKLSQKLSFHRALPLTQMAWHELSAGHTDSAKTITDEAAKAATELPAVGRLTFDTTTDLAALQFVLGRSNAAQALLKQEHTLPSGSSGSLAVLTRRVQQLRTFDLDQAAKTLPLVPWKSPAWVMTTMTLVLRGYPDKAVEWIALSPNSEVKADCLAAWGDVLVASNKSDAASQDEVISKAINQEAVPLQARVWAVVAQARSLAKQSDAAIRAAANADRLLKSVELPKDFVMPDLKGIQQLELPDATLPKLNAIAAAELARAQALLGQEQEAGVSLAAALQHLRGHAPSPVAAAKLFEATSRDINGVKAQLKQTLDLKTADRVQDAYTIHRAKCLAAFDAANARFALQTELLKAAVDWPLLNAVWKEATARATANTPIENREEFLNTDLSVRLGQRLRAANKIEQARLCENAVTMNELQDTRELLQRKLATAVEKGDVLDVARQLSAYQPAKPEGARTSTEDADWPLLWGLRLACRLAKSGQTEKAFELVEGFRDNILWREDGFEMLSALTGTDPAAAEQTFAKYRSSSLTPTERIAVFRGLCAGLTAALSTKP